MSFVREKGNDEEGGGEVSGGSWDYFYHRLEEVADRLIQERRVSSCELRRAMGKKLMEAVEALHKIEWVDSCDNGPGDEDEAIKKFLGADLWKPQVKAALLEDLNELEEKIQKLKKEAGE